MKAITERLQALLAVLSRTAICSACFGFASVLQTASASSPNCTSSYAQQPVPALVSGLRRRFVGFGGAAVQVGSPILRQSVLIESCSKPAPRKCKTHIHWTRAKAAASSALLAAAKCTCPWRMDWVAE